MRPRIASLSALLLLCGFMSAGADRITRDKILASGSEWQDTYDQYKPEPELIDVLKSRIGNNLRMDVYLGLWCPDSRNNVPVFLKIIDAVSAPLDVSYYNLERKSDKSARYFVEELKIERVPTFIVYRDGKEIGRIVENPQVTMLDDLIQILQ